MTGARLFLFQSSEEVIYGLRLGHERNFNLPHTESKREHGNQNYFTLQLVVKLKAIVTDRLKQAANYLDTRFIERQDWREHYVNSEVKVDELWSTRLEHRHFIAVHFEQLVRHLVMRDFDDLTCEAMHDDFLFLTQKTPESEIKVDNGLHSERNLIRVVRVLRQVTLSNPLV